MIEIKHGLNSPWISFVLDKYYQYTVGVFTFHQDFTKWQILTDFLCKNEVISLKNAPISNLKPPLEIVYGPNSCCEIFLL